MATAERVTRETRGGHNRKSVEQHMVDGTLRPHRHGAGAPDTLGLIKPPGKITATVASQAKWCRNPSDQHAVRNGCRFNERLAEYAAAFFPDFLCHSKGQWAGDPFDLSLWQREQLIYPLFGWVRPDGTRRFRRSYIEIPKKNGKSTLASGIGLYMLVADNEPGAELWSLGADRDQARVVHNEAVNMVEASPKLLSVLKVNHTNFNIAYRAERSYYRAMSASPRGKQGANLHCAIVDELHEWYGSELWERLRYAFRARREPLLFVITNAGNDLQSVCHRQHQKAKALLSGAIEDDDFFALICAVDEAAAVAEVEAVKNGATKLPVAQSCNPGLGSIIAERDLVSDIRDAVHTQSEMPNLLRLTYGVWNTGVDLWLRRNDWTKCQEDYTEADLEGWQCAAGLDMSKTGDMTALTLLFRHPKEVDLYRQLAYFWLPEQTMRERQHLVDYQKWVDAGELRIGGEKAIELAIIEADTAEIFERFEPEYLGFDQMYVNESRLNEIYPEVESVAVPQTIMQFAGPTAEYERLVMLGRLRHNGNDLLTWQAGHCTLYTDMNKNKRPVKPKKNDIRSIDGMVAGIMALRMLMVNAGTPSDYEEAGAIYGAYAE